MKQYRETTQDDIRILHIVLSFFLLYNMKKYFPDKKYVKLTWLESTKHFPSAFQLVLAVNVDKGSVYCCYSRLVSVDFSGD